MSQYGKWGRVKNDGFAEILTDRLILRRIASNWAEIKSGWVSRKFRWMSFFVNGDRFSSEEVATRNTKKVETAFYCLREKKIQKTQKQRDFNGIALTSCHLCLKQWRRGSETKSDEFLRPPKTVDHFS